MGKANSKIWVIVGIIILALGAFAFRFWHIRSEIAVDVKTGPVQESIYGLGKVKSDKIFEFKLGIISSIRKRHVREGDSVTQGQRLIDFDGNEPLFAPISGVVVSLPYNDHENVFPQMPILRIEDLSLRFVEVALEQQGALRVRKSQKAKFSFESLRNQVFTGDVESIYPFQDQFLVRIHTDNLPVEVLTGMTADVAIEVGRKENVLLIPLAGIASGKVVRVRNGDKEKVDVKIGITDGEWAELASGDITRGDKILLMKKD